jgi:hypothetical protein
LPAAWNYCHLLLRLQLLLGCLCVEMAVCPHLYLHAGLPQAARTLQEPAAAAAAAALVAAAALGYPLQYFPASMSLLLPAAAGAAAVALAGPAMRGPAVAAAAAAA